MAPSHPWQLPFAFGCPGNISFCTKLLLLMHSVAPLSFFKTKRLLPHFIFPGKKGSPHTLGCFGTFSRQKGSSHTKRAPHPLSASLDIFWDKKATVLACSENGLCLFSQVRKSLHTPLSTLVLFLYQKGSSHTQWLACHFSRQKD